MDQHEAPSQDGIEQAPNDSASIEAANILKQELEKPSTNNNKRSLLSRIPFLRNNSDSKIELTKGCNEAEHDAKAFERVALKNNATRRARSRRGSLRKAALLSLGKTRSDKEKRALEAELIGLNIPQDEILARNTADDSPISASPESDDYPTPRASTDDNGPGLGMQSSHQDSTTSEESLPLVDIHKHTRQKDISTTDEEELRQSSHRLQVPDRTISSAALQLEGFSGNISSRRGSTRARSPLASLPTEPTPPSEAWDYAETEWWGWAILSITWVVFVMGMGSCFEVWSWAWAIGKTPYAPPELEDDPTLPIVGYYPALIILTGVMAWIWVFTAWVGMKYFRHAKIS